MNDDLFDYGESKQQDITQNRHSGNTESEAAFEKIHDSLPRQRAEVLEAIKNHPKGITCKELATDWNVGMNVISGRFSELKRDKRIIKIGVRDGSAIMQINETNYHD
jgi:hypothetical protein